MTRSGMFDSLFGCHPESITGNVILSPFLPAGKFVRGTDKKNIFRGKIYSGLTVSSKDGSYTVINCRMGSSLAGDCVLLLGKTKAERIIYAGSSGGLGPSARGEIILCENAFSGGGFLEHYSPEAGIDKALRSNRFFSASKTFIEDLWLEAMKLTSCPKMFQRGNIFTIASLLAEDRLTLRKIEKKGFLGIDMELSAVYQAAEIAGLQAAGILFVSDLPLKKPFWEDAGEEENKKVALSLEKTIELAVLEAKKNF